MSDVLDRAGDIDEFTQLKADEDPRTVTEMRADDNNFEEGELTKVTPYKDGSGWSVQFGHTGLGVPRIEGKPEPSVGDTIRVYGSWGFDIYGIDLNGVEVFWRTPWERFAKRVEWLAGYDREKRERFEKNEAEMDRRYEALPAPLRARIDRFRSEAADFRIDAVAYEMAAAGDAPKIARALAEREGWALDDDLRADAPTERIEAAVSEFIKRPYDEQREIVPDLDEGHSGNTFGGACRLAYAVMAGEKV